MQAVSPAELGSDRKPSSFEPKSTPFIVVDTDNRHIVSMKSQGLSQTPQEIMEKYNGCSVPP